MAKPNEVDKWAAELEPEPKQLWMVAAGAEAKSFYMMKPEIWVPVTLRCPWGGERVNLLRDERGLSCVYIYPRFHGCSKGVPVVLGLDLRILKFENIFS